ncbi:MAG TPA: hypothetical protein VFM11_06270 [Burkholderiales bacterium]|nr:hypothetical protein [Burkholderiales bacterium]
MAPVFTASAAAIVIVIVSVLHAVVLLFRSNNHSTIDKQFTFLAQIYQISDSMMNFDARFRLNAARTRGFRNSMPLSDPPFKRNNNDCDHMDSSTC